ncbi:MAG: 8-amino-7-oxononanoate synthase [Roseivirga sp.]|nr:8-amino-7-oxononanoate synthase [Roseivirga sp.]
MPDNETRLSNLLDKRSASNSYRSINLAASQLIDFSSNDYLGLARSESLKANILKAYTESASSKNGSTGSRLLTGTSSILEATEHELTQIFETKAGLLFSSGYMANLAFFSSVPQKDDTILYDELSHACIKDGCRLSLARKFPFRHNDLNQLEQKLSKAEGNIYIACESVYSMDGDFAPLERLVELAQQYGAKLVVDEAHSTGSFGKGGAGLVNALGLREKVYAAIHTFGKGMGVHGAFISGSKTLREFLINFARPFIYTTAPSDFECISISQAFRFLEKNQSLQQDLQARIALFQTLAHGKLPLIQSSSSIQAILVPGNSKIKQMSQSMYDQGFDVRPILSPTVKASEERIRICLHTYNSQEEITKLVSTLTTYLS